MKAREGALETKLMKTSEGTLVSAALCDIVPSLRRIALSSCALIGKHCKKAVKERQHSMN